MGIPTTVLDPGAASPDPVIEEVYNLAIAIVNSALELVDGGDLTLAGPTATPSYYTWAVYNLAGHFLVLFAQDDPTLTPPDNTYWQTLRTSMNLNSFVAGVIQSSSDVSTSQSLAVPDFVKNLTVADLGYLQTPWGRAYMAFAQAYGPTIWGLTP
jgi:hypothetical protein